MAIPGDEKSFKMWKRRQDKILELKELYLREGMSNKDAHIWALEHYASDLDRKVARLEDVDK